MIKKKADVKTILLIITVSSILGFTYNALSKSGIKLIREEIKVEEVNELELNTAYDDSEEISDNLKAIGINTALKLHQSGKAVFIDARDQWDFKEGHIAGAVNIPEFSFEPDNEMVKSLDKSTIYVVYCDGDDCDTSKRLAKELVQLSFTNLYIFTGGFSVWQEFGNPIETGELK